MSESICAQLEPHYLLTGHCQSHFVGRQSKLASRHLLSVFIPGN